MDVAMHRLHMAKEDLDTAYLTFNAGQYRGANNRAYYSIYHTISAVLAKEGVAFKRHKDTLGYFNKNYINTEVFPKELGRKIVSDSKPTVVHNLSFPAILLLKEQKEESVSECTLQP